VTGGKPERVLARDSKQSVSYEGVVCDPGTKHVINIYVAVVLDYFPVKGLTQTNQWRLILSGFAYTLFERMSASNLRLKLIKVGAVIIRNTRRIRVLMNDGYPHKDELTDLVRRLVLE